MRVHFGQSEKGSNEEAGRYLETFKAFEHKDASAIKARVGHSTLEKAFCEIAGAF